ncbi:MAG: hypothetical protein L6367_15135 [Cellulomonas sp.]|nr:hypothetical protein [Cellulomonas sp.]
MAARRSDEPEPLGSFSQPAGPPVPGTASCLSCGEPRITRIRMRTPSGIPAVFVSCPRCEKNAWFAVDGDGEPLTEADIGPVG